MLEKARRLRRAFFRITPRSRGSTHRFRGKRRQQLERPAMPIAIPRRVAPRAGPSLRDRSTMKLAVGWPGRVRAASSWRCRSRRPGLWWSSVWPLPAPRCAGVPHSLSRA